MENNPFHDTWHMLQFLPPSLQDLMAHEGMQRSILMKAAMGACSPDVFTFAFLRSYPFIFDLHQVISNDSFCTHLSELHVCY